MEQPVIIDLQNFQGPLYSGRARGETARRELRVDSLDEKAALVRVKVPADTYTVTSSFFLGMFGPSIRKLGSRLEFRKKFVIEAPPAIQDAVDEYIDQELQKKSLFPTT